MLKSNCNKICSILKCNFLKIDFKLAMYRFIVEKVLNPSLPIGTLQSTILRLANKTQKMCSALVWIIGMKSAWFVHKIVFEKMN